MNRGWRFVLWLLATAATTGVAYVAVNTAGSEVTDRPLTGVVAATSPSISTTSRPVTATTTTTAVSPTASGSSSTTADWQRTTLNSAGGSIIVSHRPQEVRLESVIPQAGFAYEINDEGPDRVEVEFEAGEARYRLRAEWTSSGFITDVESDED
jgi:hypothetical protein